MKKVLLIILVLVASTAFGIDEWVTVTADTEFAYSTGYKIYAVQDRVAFNGYLDDYFILTLGIGVELLDGHVFAKGSAKIDMYKNPSGAYFSPMQLDSDISAGIRFSIFEAGLYHRCNHPIYTWGYDEGLRRDEAETKFYIKAGYEFNLF